MASEKNKSRRSFLKNTALASFATGLFPASSIHAKESSSTQTTNGTTATGDQFTILYTSDIHAQLHTHDEFFWENGKAVYRKRGGLAVLKTMIEAHRKVDPAHTVLLDGGDYFHGSAIASLTEGEALIPLLNAFNYDLILPGNWEVVYKKEKNAL